MTMIDENWVKSATPGLCDRHFRGGTWVDIIAHIRCIETGEVHKYETQTIFWDEDENYPNTYIWSDTAFLNKRQVESVEIYLTTSVEMMSTW